jgi:hypothetical protein
MDLAILASVRSFADAFIVCVPIAPLFGPSLTPCSHPCCVV